MTVYGGIFLSSSLKTIGKANFYNVATQEKELCALVFGIEGGANTTDHRINNT